ncbi:MAG TPA: hypothetical protein VF613_13375 [Longimicrobium sp.]|jgi:hypothetical protein
MRRGLIVASLLLAGCGEKGGDFEGRVTGSIEGPMRGTAWHCEGPRGSLLVVHDERRKAMIAFTGAPGAIKPGAWLLRQEALPGGFGMNAMMQLYPDPDAERLEARVRGGTLTIDAIDDGLAAGRYQADVVTVDVIPTLKPDGRVGRLPNKAGTLVGFFKAVKRECPASPPQPS